MSEGAAAGGQSPLQVDVVVIGAGPGGYTAAFRAADLGKSVALVERYPALGGVCLHVGCIPSKAYLHVAEVVTEARALADRGVVFGEPSIEVTRLREFKSGVVGKLASGLAALAGRRKVKVVQGRARFTGPNSIVATGDDDAATEIRFAHAIVAVGSRPSPLPGMNLPPHPRILDSTSALELADVPQRLLVIGGGIIGLEMAAVYSALGSRVTVVEVLDSLLAGVDRDLVRPLERVVRERYENVLLATRVENLAPNDRGVDVRFAREGAEAPAPDTFDRVLVAVGRRPNGGDIDAEKAGVEVDERGFLAVDESQRTNVPHIFAIGDVVGQPMLAHKAMHQAKVAAEVAAGKKAAFDPRAVPSVAYTDPEVAWAGLTEIEAKGRKIAVEKAVFPWQASGRALGIGRSEGLTKLLFDPESGRVVGGGVVGPGAGDLVSEIVLAIEMGADAEDLALTIHPHPTLSESIGVAAEVAAGIATDLYAPKKRRP